MKSSFQRGKKNGFYSSEIVHPTQHTNKQNTTWTVEVGHSVQPLCFEPRPVQAPTVCPVTGHISGTLIPAFLEETMTKTSPPMTLLLSLRLPGLLHSLHPLSKPLSLPSPPHARTHTHSHAVHAERPGCSHCLAGYLLSQHLVGEGGISEPPSRLRNASSCLTLPPRTLPVLFSAHCGQAPHVTRTGGAGGGAGGLSASVRARRLASTLACSGMNGGRGGS